jgi:peptide/nickel transport system ATP-binding protein/oligopeptide transport system ATP-binding protein
MLEERNRQTKQSPIIRLKNISKKYEDYNLFSKKNESDTYAVKGVDLEIRPNETVAVVGESGCGKSTVAKLILGLIEPTDGKIFYDGIEKNQMKKNEKRKIMKDVQMVFQDPYGAFNPKMKIKNIIAEPLSVNMSYSSSEIDRICQEVIEHVGLKKEDLIKYPDEFSGGQRQRIAIARAIIGTPRLIICDEPVSALDLLVQAQILNLLKDIQEEKKLSYLFISHDLAVVKYVSDYVVVMYLGKIVEKGSKNQIFDNPKHPYTKLLLDSSVSVHKRMKDIQVCDDIDIFKKDNKCCPFYNRCSLAKEKCREEEPDLKEYESGHEVACFLLS